MGLVCGSSSSNQRFCPPYHFTVVHFGSDTWMTFIESNFSLALVNFKTEFTVSVFFLLLLSQKQQNNLVVDINIKKNATRIKHE